MMGRMRRTESIALRSTGLRWDPLTELLPQTLEALGLSVLYGTGGDGQVTMIDHREDGCIVLLDDASVGRRAALALATKAGVAVELFEVIGTGGTKRSRFRTAAFLATAAGELRPAEGKELDLEDPEQTWGGGDLEAQSARVLEEFARLDGGAMQTKRFGYKRRPAARPSTPRVATLLASLQKARSHEAVPQPDGRFELRIVLAAGGKQTSYCSAAELEELQRLLAGRKG